MKYKAMMVVDGVCPTYEGETIDEVLEKAAEDCWVENHIDKGWVFADPDEDWRMFRFSHFMVTKDYEIVMCVWNPVLIKDWKGE